MKKILMIGLSCLLAFSLAACAGSQTSGTESVSDSVQQESTDGVQIPNPFVDCDSLDQAAETAGFDFSVPEKTPNGDSASVFRVMKDQMIEVVYSSDAGKLTLRKARGGEDASGNYNSFDKVEEITVGESVVTVKGDGEKVYVATWNTGDFAFSIDAENGLTQDDVIAMISEMK